MIAAKGTMPRGVQRRRWGLWLCALLQLVAGVVEAQASARAVPEDAVYGYTDDRGRVVYAQRLSDVPPALRPYARRLDAQPTAASGSLDAVSDAVFSWADERAPTAAKAAPVVYRYRGPGGRTTYTNIASNVPAAQRASGAVDLSKVSLNSPLGRELDQGLKQRYDRLREASFCKQARAELDQPWWKRLSDEALRLWQAQRLLVVCAAIGLVLLLITPRMSAWVGGAPWAKTLSTAFSILGVVALVGFSFMQAKRSIGQLEQRAEPCDEAAWAKTEHAEQPLVKRLGLLRALEQQTRALEQVHAEGQL